MHIFLRPVVLLCLTMCGMHFPGAFAADMVDMGPLSGSVQGHVWSKVINEAGHTKGRNETWRLNLAAPAQPEFIVKCPDAYPLEVTVQMKNSYGESSEYKLDRVAGGFYKKFSSSWDPKTTRDIRVLVATRQAGTDQRYQLTVNLLQAGVKTVADSPIPVTSPAGGAFIGAWSRSEGGRIVEMMEIVQAGTGIEIIYRDRVGGPETGRARGAVAGNELSASNARRKVKIALSGSGRITYASANHDGSSPWNGEFVRLR